MLSVKNGNKLWALYRTQLLEIKLTTHSAKASSALFGMSLFLFTVIILSGNYDINKNIASRITSLILLYKRNKIFSNFMKSD